MSGLADAAIAVAVVALVIVRQVRPRRVSEGRAWWILPAVLAYLAVRQGGWIDPHHQAASAGLLAAEIAIGCGMGAAWAYTTRIWRDGQGVAWARGTKITAAVWAGAIVLRLGLAGIAELAGVHEGSGSLMLALAATLLVRTGVLVWRATNLGTMAVPVTATP